MNKKVLWIGAAVIAIISIGLSYYLKPMPIIKNADAAMVYLIQYNVDDDMVRLEDFDEQAVLTYLETCMHRRTFKQAGNYAIENVELRLLVDTGYGYTEEIMLGKINYGKAIKDSIKREIVDSTEVLKTLRELLGYESSFNSQQERVL